MRTTGFHEGERAVQHRAGLAHEAARLEGMLRPARLTGGAANFLAQRDLAVLTARSRTGRLWTSVLLGAPGFLNGDGTTLNVHAVPAAGDPLHGLAPGQDVGLLVIDFAIRRRVRVNGTLTGVSGSALKIEAEQAFGNCPSYIQQRDLHLGSQKAEGRTDAPSAGGSQPGEFVPDQARIVTGADTFFLGTTHPARGTDTSHKGGSPGFVRVEGSDLWWPDYAGNNMFNSMGNIAVEPTTSLLFIDFSTGTALQLSGTAELQWTTPGAPGDDGGTGRRVRFHPEQAVTTTLCLRGGRADYSSDNPILKS